MTKCKPVSSGVPQRSILVSKLFNISVNHRDLINVIQCTLSKFVDDTKRSDIVNTLEGSDAI